MPIPFIGAEQLASLLPMADAIAALEVAFGGELPTTPDRSHYDVGEGDLLVMPSWGMDGVGVKLVTVAPGNPVAGLPLIHGVYVLFGKPNLQPVALFDGAALTALRTAAVSGLATKYLAAPDAATLLIFGAGVQAHAHLEAMVAVRPIETAIVVSRSPGRARHLLEAARTAGLQAESGNKDAVERADIICTCTTSTEPLYDGTSLGRTVHINAVGSYKPSARELDDQTIRSARVVVDTRTAIAESGDLAVPIQEGLVDAREIDELSTIVRAKGPAAGGVTVFKSVGAAFEDLVVAQAAGRTLLGS